MAIRRSPVSSEVITCPVGVCLITLALRIDCISIKTEILRRIKGCTVAQALAAAQTPAARARSSVCSLHEDREKNKDPRERASAGDVRGDVRPAASDPRDRLDGIIQVTLGRVSAEGSRCPAGMTPRRRDRHAGGGFLVSITRERFEPRTGYPPRRPPDACTSLASASADASSSGETRGRDETGSKLA